jgi:hypothetical protein
MKSEKSLNDEETDDWFLLTDEEVGDYLAEIQLEEMKIKKWEEEENE